VPLVAKLSVTLVAGSTLPLPDTLLWTTPRAAVTVSVEVRAELFGVPMSAIPNAIMAAAIAARMYRCQLLAVGSRRLLISVSGTGSHAGRQPELHLL
jgi:hypothetical protein